MARTANLTRERQRQLFTIRVCLQSLEIVTRKNREGRTHHDAAINPHTDMLSRFPSCRCTTALALSSAARYAACRPPGAVSGCRGGTGGGADEPTGWSSIPSSPLAFDMVDGCC